MVTKSIDGSVDGCIDGSIEGSIEGSDEGILGAIPFCTNTLFVRIKNYENTRIQNYAMSRKLGYNEYHSVE